MQSLTKTTLYAICLACFMVSTYSLQAMDPDVTLGRWAMKTDFNGQSIEATLTLRFDGSKLLGTWNSRGQDWKISKISIRGGQVEFERDRGGTGMPFKGSFTKKGLEGEYKTPMGTLKCSGTLIDESAGTTKKPKPSPKAQTQSGRPIISKKGKTLLWADEDEKGKAEYFNVTDALIDVTNFDHGIGKDRIAAIDTPRFVPADENNLEKLSFDENTKVLGVFLNGVAKAYPVRAMSRHEIVNDKFGDKSYAVLW